MPKTKTEAADIQIMEVSQGRALIHVVGTSPLILNKLSEKAKHELLMPKGRKNAAERSTTLKHNPVDEFRASAHKLDNGPTYLALPGAAFKKALASAALDMPGTKKSQIGRLTYIASEYVHVYGVPQLYMAVVRSADMNKTPDIRTRCIVPHWAATFELDFVQPILKFGGVINLVAASGVYIGVGDGRPEKGALSFGRFRTAAEDDQEFADIVATGGREVQLAAMESPKAYDEETRELLGWFNDEVASRNFEAKPRTRVAVAGQ